MGPVCQLPSRGDTARVCDVAGTSEVAEVLAPPSGEAAAGVESSEPQLTNSIEVMATATAADRHRRWVARATVHSLITVFDTTISLSCGGASAGATLRSPQVGCRAA
jgi:hypothetical protein